MENVLAILLAGGAGERLHPLTKDTAKPAVPFGGAYRIIDFTLSNCVNSGVRRIFILAQYKSLDLTRHIRDGWSIFSAEMGEYIEVIPPMRRVSEDYWYQGTADAVFQNFQSIEVEDPDAVLVVASDHIYKMNYHEMLDQHQQTGADITIATIQAPPEEASRFGVVDIDADYRVVGFEEKPKPEDAMRSSFNPDMISASMGIYVFNTDELLRALHEDAQDPASSHDFGKDIIPRRLKNSTRSTLGSSSSTRNAVRNSSLPTEYPVATSRPSSCSSLPASATSSAAPSSDTVSPRAATRTRNRSFK